MEDFGKGYSTPEEAARGDIPERFAHITSIEYPADGSEATMDMLTNEVPAFEDYTVYCVRGKDGLWHPTGGHN